RVTLPAVATAVAIASRLRGERIIHARGRTLTGRLHVDSNAGTGAALFDVPADHEVLVRFSRGAGLPTPLPDVHGLAVRVLDAYGSGRHQDLLYSSTLSLPVVRWLPVPVRRPRFYGSLLPYDVGGAHRMLGASHGDDG